MSVTASLTNALSGLTAATRSAQIVSANVANATTEGYGVRSLALSAASVGGNGAGVRIDGAGRSVNAGILADRRDAQAGLSNTATTAEYFAQIENAIGLPDAAGSLNKMLVAFEAALVSAESRPDIDTRLQAAARAAGDVAGKLNAISDQVQRARLDADRQIEVEVNRLNTTLAEIEELNRDITSQLAQGQDALGLMDQRQVLISRVAEIVPVSVMARDRGQVALITKGGGILLDGPAARLSFESVNQITAETTRESGALSTIEMNGRAVDFSAAVNPLAGGKLAALFQVRDTHGVETQAGLDAFAQALITRFEDSGTDPSLAPGQPGLFTDAGAAADPAQVVGLAARIALNPTVDPGQGAEVWRLRDGVGAPAPGLAGNTTQLAAFVAALNTAQLPSAPGAGSAPQTLFSGAATLLSQASTANLRAQGALAFETARFEAFRQAELTDGVDTDAEMQKLLQIEQLYAANAKVIQTVDDMLELLNGI